MAENYARKALVTGGAGDIGFSICRRLLQEGYDILIYDLPGEERAHRAALLNQEFGNNRVSYFAGDLALTEKLIIESQALARDFGPFEVLVNNAGIDTTGLMESNTYDDFFTTQKVNAEAAYILCKALIPGMKTLGSGQIVNILSIILSGGWDQRVPYAMSKGSLLGLTRSLARELGPWNIRVNAVSPGAIPTILERKFWQDDRTELDRQILEKQSLKFRGSTEDVANAVWFLISPESRFITGHELHVNGGWYMG